MENIEILTDVERLTLPLVINKRSKFKSLIRTSLINHKNIFSNGILIQGNPGTGKTTLVVQYLDQLKEEGIIADYVRAAGHITQVALFDLLGKTKDCNENGRPRVLVLDDVDCLADQGCLELMKAAFDTKTNSPTNRMVYYLSNSQFFKKRSEQESMFKYNGFGIIITNNKFNPNRISIHQEALFDRIQVMNIDFQKSDMMIYNAHLVEDYLNENPDGLEESAITKTVDLFNNEIRKWMKYDAFARSRVNFSIRLIKKFIDAERLCKTDWKDFNTEYKRLEAATQFAIEENEAREAGAINSPVNPMKAPEKINTIVEGTINPKTGRPYSQAYIYKLRKAGKIA